MANDFQNSIANNVGTSRTDLYTTPSALVKKYGNRFRTL